jgi:hypothetical protein
MGSRNRSVFGNGGAGWLILAALIVFAMRGSQALVINEIGASNHSRIADADGDYEDWIELYNNSAANVPLAGYRLTDDPTTTGKWVFPAVTILPNAYLLIWASNKDRRTAGQPLHANFRLEEKGEFLGLYNASGGLVDSLTFGLQVRDASYGRSPNGSTTWLFFATPTPNDANNTPAASGSLIDGSLTAAYPDLATAGVSLEKADEEFPWRGHPAAWKPCSVRLWWATPLAQYATPGGANSTQASAARRWPSY